MMTKAGLVERVHGLLEGELSKVVTGRAVNAVLEGISGGLDDEWEVRLMGFGTFKVKERDEREGRNPQTGEAMIIPARNVISFKPGASLKERVNS